MPEQMDNHSPLYQTYARAPVAFERGEGVWLEATDGRRFMDFSGGIAVNVLGHAHPHLVKALKDQAEKLWHTSNLFEIPGQRRLAERLTAATFADRAFFTNSGAEALECAIKTARRYHYVNGAPERIRILTFQGAFHGRTLATIAAGGQAKYLEGFGPKAPGFDQLPFGDHDALRQTAAEADVAAILIEPIQGEGGIRKVPLPCLTGLRELCDELGILLIYDEVQTGVGRTGKFYAYQHSGAAPDIMASAKGIGGGFPMGVCLATEEAAKGMTPGTHGTTYGGNPLAMAVGNAVLDVVLEDGFLDHVKDVALLFKQSLASLIDRYPDVLEEVRGEGLLIGLKAKVPNGDLVVAMRENGLLAAPAGDNVVRLLPPLTVTAEEVRQGMDRIEAAVGSLSLAGERKSA
ncbi:aspartate aminotransferase family protein [Aurantimonas sp. VKM B-3413]|uniref:aspartate aminotransferase family protein n=1 Tax=Aurantimonas sp. VKM B-3413 TaxID=2779401 RepID=UPI001E2BEEB5|nr:aspartate aminotransferase family protein [Aurantimonas sp. VKM B-3413]MCB8837795.1 aspartate aminotransferase family protein [Aurantimonas sp. VKM B-3413]